MERHAIRTGAALLSVLTLMALPGPARGQATHSEILRGTLAPPAMQPDLEGADAGSTRASPGEAPPAGATEGPDSDEGLSFRRAVAPAALITAGLFTFKDEGFLNRESIREWRNEFIPEFEDHLDDYGQFAAGGLALGLNAFGVNGKHELGRATVTYATSMGLMMVGIHSIKNLADVKRPDGSNNESFPSGHTAASFASARFLDREYGDVSYLYSLGGYGFAAMTGVFRQLNNKHWLSDVLVGAGIGLLSTDIAYAILDELYGQKGVAPERPPRTPGPRGNPSFVDFRIGYAGHAGDVEDAEGPFHIGGGWTAGFEGAWFPWRHVGIGAESGVASFPIDTERFRLEDPALEAVVDSIVTQPLGSWSVYVGPYFDVGLSERFAVTGKVTAGVSLGATGTISGRITEAAREEVGSSEVALVEFAPQDAFGFAVGAGVRTMVSERIGLRVFGEWNYSKPSYEIRPVIGVAADGSLRTGPVQDRPDVDFSYFAVGASVSAVLW